MQAMTLCGLLAGWFISAVVFASFYRHNSRSRGR